MPSARSNRCPSGEPLVGNLRLVTLRLSFDGSQEKSEKKRGGVPVLGKSADVGFSEKPHICQKKANMGHGYVGHLPRIFYVRFGLAAYAQAFGRVEWVLSFTLPSDESLGFLLPSRGAGLAPRLAQQKGEPFDKLRASSGAPGRLLRPCSGFRLPASPGHPEKPHICQKKAKMGHGVCGPPASCL